MHNLIDKFVLVFLTFTSNLVGLERFRKYNKILQRVPRKIFLLQNKVVNTRIDNDAATFFCIFGPMDFLTFFGPLDLAYRPRSLSCHKIINKFYELPDADS